MTGGQEVKAVIDHARSWLSDPGAPANEPGEETATRFARALVQLADACVVGVPCEKHGDAVHGREAEELRKGVENILADPPGGDIESNQEWRASLLRLLDEVDARDSLVFLEATTCDIEDCRHHARPDCPCDHPAGTEGPCAGCNCCDPSPE